MRLLAYILVGALLVVAGLYASGPTKEATNAPCFDAGSSITELELAVASHEQTGRRDSFPTISARFDARTPGSGSQAQSPETEERR